MHKTADTGHVEVADTGHAEVADTGHAEVADTGHAEIVVGKSLGFHNTDRTLFHLLLLNYN